MKYHSWMRKKSKHKAFAIEGFGRMGNALQNLFMANMHAVESSDGNNSFFIGMKSLYGIENFQLGFVFDEGVNLLHYIV